jgi:hypothetical protein
MSHSVKFTIPERELGKADIEFSVKKHGSKFGTLKVSKGAIVWTPANKQYGFKIGWTKFDELAQENGSNGHK